MKKIMIFCYNYLCNKYFFLLKKSTIRQKKIKMIKNRNNTKILQNYFEKLKENLEVSRILTKFSKKIKELFLKSIFEKIKTEIVRKSQEKTKTEIHNENFLLLNSKNTFLESLIQKYNEHRFLKSISNSNNELNIYEKEELYLKKIIRATLDEIKLLKKDFPIS